MYGSPQQPSNVDSEGGQWWNMFMDTKDSTNTATASAEPIQKLAPNEPTESASSARSSLLFAESGRASSSSSEIEEQDDADSENASTTTDTSSIAARRRNSQKRLGGSRGGNMTALSGATLLLEAETDGEDGESAIGDTPEMSSDKRHSSSVWNIIPEQRRYYVREFSKLQPNLTGLIPGLLAKQYFLRSELPNQILAQIWAMSDLDADGALNITEFCCAMHLVVAIRNGVSLPSILPAELLQSALQIADRVAADSALKSPEKRSTTEPETVVNRPGHDQDNAMRSLPVPTEPWPNIGNEPIQQTLSFPSNTPSRASSMASNLASFDDRPPASAIYPFAVRPAPALPSQIPPPPPPRRPPHQQQAPLPSSPPATTASSAVLGVNSLLTSHAVSVSASSLQPLLPVNDSASITSAASDSSQLQLLVPPLEQLRTRNQQLVFRYRELLAELERIRMERTTLQSRLKQFRNTSHRHNTFDQVHLGTAVRSRDEK